MKTGRPRTAAALHLIGGNASKLSESDLRARLAAEHGGPKVDITLPVCPAFLSESAAIEWDRLGEKLVVHGLISDLDLAAFAGYCQSYAEWTELSMRVRDGGYESMVETAAKSGFKQMSVLVQLRNRAHDQMIKLMGEFGLTPASRAKFTQVSAQLNLFDKPDGNKNQAKAPESKAAQYFTR